LFRIKIRYVKSFPGAVKTALVALAAYGASFFGCHLFVQCLGVLMPTKAASIAAGRSDLAGWDFHPLEKRRLITAHTPSRQSNLYFSNKKMIRLCRYFLQSTLNQQCCTYTF